MAAVARSRERHLRSLDRESSRLSIGSTFETDLLCFKVLSFATIIIGTINYAVPTGHVHPNFIYALFWFVIYL